MLDDRHRALATVDLAAVRHNVAHLVALLPAGTALCAVVKANGYGHGAVPVARSALRAGASWLGVATVAEAEELREAAIAAPLLIFGPLTGAEAVRAAKARAEVTVWSESSSLRRCAAACGCTSSSTRGWAGWVSVRPRRRPWPPPPGPASRAS